MSEGRWATTRGGVAAHPEAEVIELDEKTPADFRRHWRVEPHLLLLLEESGRVRPGHPEGGYSLWHYSMQRIAPEHWPRIND